MRGWLRVRKRGRLRRVLLISGLTLAGVSLVVGVVSGWYNVSCTILVSGRFWWVRVDQGCLAIAEDIRASRLRAIWLEERRRILEVRAEVAEKARRLEVHSNLAADPRQVECLEVLRSTVDELDARRQEVDELLAAQPWSPGTTTFYAHAARLAESHRWSLRWRPEFRSSPWISAVVPLWIFLAAGVAIVAIALPLRRRSPAGECRTCGYNLTGNTSGRCPECGTAVGVAA